MSQSRHRPDQGSQATRSMSVTPLSFSCSCTLGSALAICSASRQSSGDARGSTPSTYITMHRLIQQASCSYRVVSCPSKTVQLRNGEHNKTPRKVTKVGQTGALAALCRNRTWPYRNCKAAQMSLQVFLAFCCCRNVLSLMRKAGRQHTFSKARVSSAAVTAAIGCMSPSACCELHGNR